MKRMYGTLLLLLVLGGITFFLLHEEKKEVITKPTIIQHQPVKIDKSKIKKIIIEHYPIEGEKKSESPQKVVLIRGEKGNDEGEGWEIIEPIRSPADSYSVKSILQRLGELKFIDIASEQSKAYEDLMVDETQGIKVKVFYEEDNKVADLIIGKSTGGFTMVRLANDNRVYRTKGTINYLFSKPLRQWRDRKILSFDSNKVAKIEISNKNGHFVFERDVSKSPPTDWKIVEANPKLADFDPSKLNTIVTSLSSLNAFDFLDPPYTANPGLSQQDNPPKISVMVKKNGGEENYTLLIGNQQSISDSNEKGNYYVKLEGQNQIYIISKYLGERFTPTPDKLQKEKSTK